MASPPTKYLPYLALGFGIAGLGFSAIFVKWANAPGAVSGFYRMSLAAAVMTAPVYLNARQHPQKLSARAVAWAILAGLFFAGDLGTWNTAVLMTSATNATLFGNTSPVWVALGAWWLFREQLRPVFWVGLALALVGALTIFSADFLQHPQLGWGDALAVGAGVFYAGFMLVTQRARQGLSALTAWWISAVTSAVTLWLISLALQQPLTGYSGFTYLNLLGVALVTQVGGYLAISYALGHLPASIVAPTLLGQPVFTAVLAMGLLGEPVSVLQIFGGAFVLSGIMLVHWQR